MVKFSFTVRKLTIARYRPVAIYSVVWYQVEIWNVFQTDTRAVSLPAKAAKCQRITSAPRWRYEMSDGGVPRPPQGGSINCRRQVALWHAADAAADDDEVAENRWWRYVTVSRWELLSLIGPTEIFLGRGRI